MTKYCVCFIIAKGEKIPSALAEETVLKKRCECPKLGIVNLLPGRIVVYDAFGACDDGATNIKKITIDVVCPAFMTIAAIDSDNVALRAGGIGNTIVVPIGQLKFLEGGFYDPDAWYVWREACHQNDKNVFEQIVLQGQDAASLTGILSGRIKIITPDQAKELGID